MTDTGIDAEAMAPSDVAQAASRKSVAGFAAAVRAELVRLRKWPALWVMLGVWLLMNLTFAYIFTYIAYVTGSGPFGEQAPPELLLADVLPDAVPRVLTGGMPMFGGAIMLILGALTTGSGFGWGTWKTVLTQAPGRASSFGAALAALAGVVVATVTATLALNMAASAVIAAAESQSITWPPVGETAQAWGGGVLICGMWAAAGALIGVLARSPALAVGLGLVWTLVVENLLRGVSGLLSGLTYVTDMLPGTAAGSMAGALGANTEADGDGTPGVLTILDGAPAALLLGGYLVIFTVIATALMARRDIA